MTFKGAAIDEVQDRKAAGVDDRQSEAAQQPSIEEAKLGARNRSDSTPPSPPRQIGLSVRAENVLKELAVELSCGTPPQGKWRPPDLLLEKLTYKHLATARNCGPQTTAEIINWAKTRGKEIRRSSHAGKSLSVMWSDIATRFSIGEVTDAEIAEALERSTRRRNTRIPLDIQKLLLKLIAPSRR